MGCDALGTLLCAECAADLPFIDLRCACPRCGAPFGKINCTECGDAASASGQLANADAYPFIEARAAWVYEGVAKQLILSYKDSDEIRIDRIIASALAQSIKGMIVPSPGMDETPYAGIVPADLTDWANALVPVPASKEALRRRGYDHMGRVARICSEYTGIPVIDALQQTRKVADQRALTEQERASNRAGSFELAPGCEPLPAHIVLVDDVFTTGATSSAATAALLAGGAQQVIVTVAARVW